MVRSFRRGALAAVFALSLAPLAACAAGNDAQTLKVHPDSDAVTVGVIKVQNAWVLTQDAGDGPATVSARLFNDGSDAQTLQSLQLGSTRVTLADKDGGQTVSIPAHGTVLLGGKGNPSAVVDSSTEALRDGDVQNAVFEFSATGPVAIQLNVVPARGDYKLYGPSSLPTTQPPTPSNTPKDTSSPTGTNTPKNTGSPTNTSTPTGNASPTQ